MRMMSRRDEQILDVLMSRAGNDLDIVTAAMNEINERPTSAGGTVSLDEAILIVERLRRAREPAAIAF